MIKAHQPPAQPAARVSLFPNIKTTKNGRDFNLDKIMNAVRDGQWAEKVEAVRSGKSDKRDLPYFTGSGVFETRKETGLKKHNRRIIIDIDKHDPDDIKSLIGAGGEGVDANGAVLPDPYCEYCFTSCGGNGAALVFKINPEKHAESFEAISDYLLQKYGFACDIAVKDISRARFVSYDPEILHNPNAETFAVSIHTAPNPMETAVNMVKNAPDGERHAILLKAAKLLGGHSEISSVDAFSALTAAFTCRPYEKGYNYEATIRDGLGYGAAQPINPQASKIYHVARAKNRDGVALNDPNNQAFIYELAEAMEGNTTENLETVRATFEEVYTKNKAEHNNKNKTAIAKAEDFIKDKYNLKRNEITKRVEEVNTAGVHTVTNIHSIYRALQHTGVRFGLDRVRSLLASDFIPDYNPFKEYFEGLPAYNTKSDPIRLLASHIKVKGGEEAQEFFYKMFEKMLVRCIGCGLGDHENRTVFVLVGEKQNTGKSSFIRFLNPFGNKYYTEAPLRDNKDSEFSFTENFFYNLEELNALSNIEINKLKAIISKTIVKERRAYAADSEEEIRRCNFFGSTNKDDFLTDTENTRWICFYVDSISFDYNNKETGKKAVNITDVWSQAWHLYNDPGYNAQLTKTESETRDQINKSYEVNNVEKDVINRFFLRESSTVGRFFAVSEIIEIMVDKTQNKHKFNPRLISKSLRQLGFETGVKRINGRPTRGFFARLAEFGDVTSIEEGDKPF